MANRFRMAVKNAGDELLVAGKQKENEIDGIKISDDIEMGNIFAEENIYKPEESLPQEESILPVSKYLNNNSTSEFTKISEFLNAKISNEIYELRLNKLKEIIDSLIMQEQKQKPTLIIDHKENILLWIEAIKNGIPEKLKSILTFSIDENENIDGYQYCIVLNKSALSEVERPLEESSFNFQVFDFSTISNLSVNMGSKYSEFVQVGYLLNDNKFHEFKRFFDEFEYNNLDQNLDKCLMLFYYSITGIKNLDYNNVVEAINFAESYGNLKIYKKLFQKMNFNVDMDEHMAFINIKFMLKISKLLQESDCFSKSYKFVFEYIQKLILENTKLDVEQIFDFFNRVYDLEENSVEHFINYELDIVNMNKLTSYIMNKDSNVALFYLSIVLNALVTRKDTWENNAPYFNFINKGIEALAGDFKDIEKVINCVNENLEYKANLILIYHKQAEDNDEKRNLILQLFSKDKINKDKLIGFMIENKDGLDLVLNEFKNDLSKSSNKIQYFWDYKSQIIDINDKFKSECFSEIVDFYLKNIKEDNEYNNECIKIFNMVNSNQIEISDEVLTYLINDYENHVPIVATDSSIELILNDISKIKEARNIVTTNGNILMMQYGKSVEKLTNKEENVELINNKLPDLRNISQIKLEEFFEWCLDLYFNNESMESIDIILFYNKIIEKRESKGNILTENIFSYEKFMHLKKCLNTFDSKKIQFYLIITLDYYIKQDKDWDNEGIQEQFIKKCIEALIEDADILEYSLEVVVDHSKYFNEILSIYLENKISKEVAVNFFVKNSNERGKQWTYEIKICIDKWKNGEDFLFSEFKLSYELATNKSEFFWTFLNEAQLNSPAFKTKRLPELFQIHMKTFEPTDFHTEDYIKVLKEVLGNNIKIPKDVFLDFITKFESSINITSLSPNLLDIVELIDRIIQYKSNFDIKTVPDIMRIVGFTLKLQKITGPEEAIRLITQTNINFEGINREKYMEFVEQSLSLIMKHVNVVNKSNEIKKAICSEEFKEDYSKLYSDLIVKQINSGTLKLSKEYFKTLNNNNSKDSFELIATLIVIDFNKGLVENDIVASIQLFVDVINERQSFNLTMIEVRKYFSELENGNRLLFEEYKNRLAATTNKPQFYAAYWDEFLSGFEKYKKEYYPQAMEEYLGYIKDTANYPEACYELLKQIKKESIEVPPEFLAEIVATCEKMIVIGEQNVANKEIIKNIIEVKTQNNIKTSPDIINYINFGVKIHETTDLDEIRRLISNSNLNLDDIDFSRYEEWLDWCIPQIIHCGNTWQNHASIKRAMCSEKLKGLFFTTYIGMLADELKSAAFHDIFAQFIIFFINGRDQLGEETYIQGRSNIINVLSRCNEAKINETDKLVVAGSYDIRTKDAIAQEWEQIKKRVTPVVKQEKGLFGKLLKK